MHPDRLREFVRSVTSAMGSSRVEAGLVADHLVGANLAGHDSHGVGMLPDYVDGWSRGLLTVNQSPTVVVDRGCVTLLDANQGFGQVMGHEAMLVAERKAAEHGVAVVGLRNSFHIGRIGHWAEQLVAAGLVSIHFVNVAGNEPLVAPFGGASARFGTNPMCVAIPARDGSPALLLDMATSRIAYGKAKVAFYRGEPLPDGCMLDEHGRETTDPAAMLEAGRSGAGGALIAMGDHKGSGLAMACELLAAALLGGVIMRPETIGLRSITNNMLTIAIDPQVMGTEESLAADTDAFLGYVRASALREGFSELLVPGEPENRSREVRLGGIPLDDRTIEALAHAARLAGASGAVGLLGTGLA